MKKLISVVLSLLMICTCVVALVACTQWDCAVDGHEYKDGKCVHCGLPQQGSGPNDGPGPSGGDGKTIMIWGPQEHETIYLKYAEAFRALYPTQFEGWKFAYAGSGDAGAYSAMQKDPSNGAAIYTFANDQAANLRNLMALSVTSGENLEWSRANNSEAAVSATFIGDANGEGGYYGYPLQADNGYYMYYNKSAFRGTSIWDEATDSLKAGYTFRDMYKALDEKTDMWANGKVTWAMGDSWYMSGVFFSVGGDYSVTYDDKGKQTSADCWFSYVLPEGEKNPANGDYTVGLDAYQAAKNSFTNPDGTVNKHYAYTDGDKSSLNDYIDIHTNPANESYARAPLAAAVCGTWKAKVLQDAWGDDYAATVLPVLETDDGELFQMKNFAGYKNIGINPLCPFLTEQGISKQVKQERMDLLHKFAQFLCGLEPSLERHAATGAGPALLEALEDPSVVADVALQALNAQYAMVCVYPANYSIEALRGQPIGNGLGFRNQDSVPSNYWTPIQDYGQNMFNEFNEQKFKSFADIRAITTTLRNLQADIAQAAQ